MKPRRYQLRKEAVGVAERHPWIFRDHLSSAASVFGDGQPLRLVDGQNRVVGYGWYEADGAIAIRVTRRGQVAPDAAWFRACIAGALAKRASLAGTTDGIRLVNGESDSLPAVVADRFGETIVVSSYSTGADALARYVARVLCAVARGTLALEAPGSKASPKSRGAMPGAPKIDLRAIVGKATNVILRPARRRTDEQQADARALAGTVPALARFTEDGRPFVADLAGGQKTGTYLDLRGLRRAIATAPLQGARVLNLFAYSGMLGRAAEAAGAAHVTHVDESAKALELAAAHHVADPAKHAFVTADVFEYLPALPADEQYDLVIVDPPAMTSRAQQLPAVLAGYKKLYKAAAPHVRPGGALVAACCTSRVDRQTFEKTVTAALGAGWTIEKSIPPEGDHPAGFPQADYLKILWLRRG